MKSANTFLRIVLAAMLFVDAFRVIPLMSDTTSDNYGNTNSVQTVYAWDECVTNADCSDGIVCTSDVCNSNWLCSNPLACAAWETCDDSSGFPVCSGSAPIDAVCGSWFLSCSVGNPGNPNDTACGQDDTWDCFGVNGWADAWCMIPDVCATPPVNGDCGNAYGVCVTGQAANRNDSACGTDDTWTCEGSNGGSSDSCSVPDVCTTTPTNAVCGSTFGSCTAWNFGNPNDTACGQDDTWDCFGTNGWTDAWCMIPDVCSPTPVNGDCGLTVGQCDTGTANNINDTVCTENDTWECVWSNGGTTAFCAHNDSCGGGNPIPWVCGTATGTCTLWFAVGVNDTACNQADTWSCTGSGWGATASCSNPDLCSGTDGTCGVVFGSCTNGTAWNYNQTACNIADTWTCSWTNGGSASSCSVPDPCGWWGLCVSTPEICDGIDNDCDDEIDEDLDIVQECTVWVGACAATGTRWKICEDGQPSTYACNAVEWTPSAEICDDGIDNDCDGDIDEVACPVDTYDLALRKTLSGTTPGPFMAGDTVTFNIRVFNQGDVDAANIVVTDYIPTGLTFVSSNATTISTTATSVDLDFGAVLAWSSKVRTITFTIDSGFSGTIDNLAEISSDNGDDVDSTTDTNSSNDILVNDVINNNAGDEDDHDIESITVDPIISTDEYDLALRKTLNSNTPGPFMAGDTVTFNVRVINQGDIDANGIQVMDYIPAGLTYVSSNAAIANTATSVTMDFGSIAAWAAKTRTITFTIDSGFSGTIDNLAEIIADDGNDVDSTTDTDSTNDVLVDNVINNNGGDEDDHDIESIVVGPIVSTDEYDLALRKILNSNTPGPFMAGDTVTFNVRVINQGDIDASGIQVMDYIPAGLTYVSSNAAIANTATSVTMDFGSIAAWAAKTRTITFTIDAGFSGTIDNLAEIIADDGNDVDSTTDTDSTNDVLVDNVINNNGGDEDDHDIESIVVDPIIVVDTYDLALRKILHHTTQGPFTAWDTVTFDIRVFNQGTVTANNVVVTDYIPSWLTFVSSNASVISSTANFVELDFGTIAPGSKGHVITFTIDAGFSGTIDNLAEITADDGADIDSTTDTDSTNDVLVDNVINNTGGDEDDHDIESIIVDPIVVPNGYDLALRKTRMAATYAPGDTVTFNIRVFNQGVVNANNVEVTDYIPAGLTYVSTSATEIATTATTATLWFPMIPVGGSVLETITFTVDNNFTGTIDNKAEISSDDGNDIDSTTDTNISNDVLVNNVIDNTGWDEDDHDNAIITIIDPINPVYDLALSKDIATAGPYAPGDVVDFDITVTNEGTVPSGTFTVVDYIPAGFSFAWTNAASYTLVWSDLVLDYPSIQVWGSATITVSMLIDAGFTGSSITNNAEVMTDNGNDTDSTPGDNSTNEDDDDDETIAIDVTTDTYDLALRKTRMTSTYAPGDTVTFNIRVINQWSVAANNVEVTDYIPAGLTYVSTSATEIAVTSTDVTLWFTTIPVNGNVLETITFTVDAGANGTIENIAEISSDDGNDVDSVTDTLVNNDVLINNVIDNTWWDEDDHDNANIIIETVNPTTYDLALVKDIVTSGPYITGQDVEFAITVTNEGNVPSGAFTVIDYVPAGFTFVDSSSTYTQSWTDVIIDFANIPAWSSSTETVTMRVNGGFIWMSITNLAEVLTDNGNDTDSTEGNDSTNEDDDDWETITIIDDTTNTDEFDLALQKTLNASNSSTFAPSSSVTFDITVINQGDLNANGIVVTDYIPAWLVFDSSSLNTVSTSSTEVSLDFGSLAVWASRTETITFIIDSSFTGTALDNIAEITADNGADIDSTTDSDPSNDTLLNDVINNNGGDEDDHDIESITVTQVVCVDTGAEICDGIDNDCDGEIDEGTDEVVDCSAGQGECLATGTQPKACINGKYELGSCSAVEWTPGNEICEDGLDNDCDGFFDEQCGGTSYDLALMKVLNSSTTGPFESGDTVTFDLTVLNESNENALDVYVIDYVPTGLTFLSSSVWSNWYQVLANGDVTLNFSPITVGWSETETISFIIDDWFTWVIENWSEIYTDDGVDVDSTPGDWSQDEDDDDNALITVIDPETMEFDLALTKGLNSSTTWTFNPGDTVTFDVTVYNQGTEDAAGIEVIDYIPTGLTFASSTAPVISNNATTVVLDYGSLVAWTNMVETITFTVNAWFTGTIDNIAEISADNGEDVDSTPDTNSANDILIDDELNNASNDEDDHDVETIVVTNPTTGSNDYDLALRKTSNSSTFVQGGQVIYTITVFNQWDIDASSIEVTDYIPNGLTYVSSSASVVSETDDEIVLDFGSIVAWDSESETITFTISSSFVGDVENIAEITRDDGNDVDSTVDSSSSNDVVVDDVINNSSNDEDDHDVENIEVLRRSGRGWWGSGWGRNFCGDGNLSVTRGEQCDDGNYVDGDGCSRNCQLETVVDPVEEDPEVCQIESRCGDGIIWHNGDPTIKEQCDDGNTINGDGCSSNCYIEIPTPIVEPTPTPVVIIQEPEPVEIELPFIPQPRYEQVPMPEPLQLPAYLPETWVLNGGLLKWRVSMPTLLIRKEEENKA